MLPNFLIVGAAKCGTTSLYNYLKEHPDIYMSPVKEVNFFSSKYIPTQHERELTIEDYESYFAGAKNKKCVGECSPSYMYTPTVARDIKDTLPKCKIIIIIRNPIDRLHSHFIYSKYMGFNSGALINFLHEAEARNSNAWFSKTSMIQAGMYYKQIKEYMCVFGGGNICIVAFDSLKDEPVTVMKKIFLFLDVDNSFQPKVNQKYNVGRESIVPIFSQLLGTPNAFKHYTKYLVPKKYRNVVKEYLYKTILLINARPVTEKLKAEDRRYLLSIYREDILKLEKLLGIDLSTWLR